MLLTTKMEHNLLGSLTFVWGYIDTTNAEKYSYWNLKELLSNPEYSNRLKLNNKFTYVYRVYKNIVLPTVSPKDLENEQDVAMFVGEYGLDRLELDNSLLNDIIEGFKEELPKLELEELEALVSNACECLELLANMDFIYRLEPTLDPIIKKRIIEYNNASHGEEINYTDLKKAVGFKRMEDETDRIYIELPKAYYSNTISMEDIVSSHIDKIWAQSSVFTPYPEISTRITASNYRDVDVDLPRIVGNEANNNLQLQPNEEDFYRELIKYIDKSVELYCKENNVPVDYVKDNCIFKDTPFEKIMMNLVKMFINKNWSHSTEVPINDLSLAQIGKFEGEGDSSDDDDSTGSSTSSDGSDNLIYALDDVYRTGKNSYHQAYFDTITEFIMSNKGNIFSWAEIVIKLARWGERKPTRLTLNFPESNSDNRLELDLFSMKTDYTDESVEVEKISDRDYLLSGIIMSSDHSIPLVDDSAIFKQFSVEPFKELPPAIVGVQVIQFIKLNGERKSRLIIMDLPTLMKNLDNIEGIEIDDNGDYNIIVDESKVLSNIMYLDGVSQIMNSKNKTLFRHINSNDMYLNAIPDLTKDELKSLNMFSYIRLIASRNTISIMLKTQNNVINLLNRQSKMYLNYLSDLQTLKNDNMDCTLADALNLFKDYYIDNLAGVSTTNSGQTNLFSQQKQEEEKFKPTVIIQLSKTEFYLIVADESEETKNAGCISRLIHFEGEPTRIDTSVCKSRLLSHQAMRNLVVLYADVNHKNKIYVSDTVRELIGNKMMELYKTTDAVKILPVLDRVIAKQKSK